MKCLVGIGWEEPLKGVDAYSIEEGLTLVSSEILEGCEGGRVLFKLQHQDSYTETSIGIYGASGSRR